jgi:DNA-binding response OmpR family regulator
LKLIAVFEPNRDLAELIEFILTRAGHHVTLCSDLDALSQAAFAVDVIVIETFRNRQAAADCISDPRKTFAPLVICATGVPESASKLLRNPQAQMLLKPFTDAELVDAVSAPPQPPPLPLPQPVDLSLSSVKQFA